MALGDRLKSSAYIGGGGAGSSFVSFHIFSILTFESPILSTRLRGVPINVGGAFRRRRRIIDDSPATIGDHPDLDSVGPDEVVRLI